MDYEFLTDVTGQPLAKCELESEHFGDWLSHDVGTNNATITTLIARFDDLLCRRCVETTFTGKIYHLIATEDEVDLFLNNNELAAAEFEEWHSDGPVAGCGLVELKHLLENWQAFIA